MKNLKKLSVVLFATLLSFNFTSCIDDGVSAAVDQVYLAQAEFLRAQAALNEAEAQYQLSLATVQEAEAQLRLAMAEVQLSIARGNDADAAEVLAASLRANGLNDANIAKILAEIARLDATNAAEVAEIIAETLREDMWATAEIAELMAEVERDNLAAELSREATSITNAYNEANYAILLAEAGAKADKAIQGYIEAQENATAVHAAAMVGLREAIVAANDDVVYALYVKYGLVIDELNTLLDNEVKQMAKIAKKGLFLDGNDFSSTASQMYMMSTYRADSLVEEMNIIAEMAKMDMYAAEIAALQAATPDAILVQIEGLNDDIADLNNELDEMEVVSTTLATNVKVTSEAWKNANKEYKEVLLKEGDVATAEGLLAGHLNDMSKDSAKIVYIGTVISDSIPAYEQNILDVTAATSTIVSAILDTVAADAALEQAMKKIRWRESLKPAFVTAWNTKKGELAAAEAAVVTARKNRNDARELLGQVPGEDLEDLEGNLNSAIAELEYRLAIIGLEDDITVLTSDLRIADSLELVAQLAWEMNPDGIVWGPGADGVIGVHTDDDVPNPSGPGNVSGIDRTWVKLRRNVENPLDNPDNSYKFNLDNIITAQSKSDLKDSIGNNAPPNAKIFLDWADLVDYVVNDNAGDATTAEKGWYNVEADDDDSATTYGNLLQARLDADAAQFALNARLGITDFDEQTVLAEAQTALLNAYILIGLLPEGSTWGGAGFDMMADAGAIETYFEEVLEVAIVTAKAAVVTAEGAVAAAWGAVLAADAAILEAQLELGVEDTRTFTTINDTWRPANDNDPNTAYQDKWNSLQNLAKAHAAHAAAIMNAKAELAAFGTEEELLVDVARIEARIAETALLIPSHEYAVQFLKDELAALYAEYGIDLDDPLWENDADHQDLLMGGADLLHDYLPEYGDYIDALSAQDAHVRAVRIIKRLRRDVTALKESIETNLGTAGELTYEQFEIARQGEIDSAQGKWDAAETALMAAEKALDAAKVVIAKGHILQAEMEAELANLEADLATIQAEITLVRAAADALVVRINAAMSN